MEMVQTSLSLGNGLWASFFLKSVVETRGYPVEARTTPCTKNKVWRRRLNGENRESGAVSSTAQSRVNIPRTTVPDGINISQSDTFDNQGVTTDSITMTHDFGGSEDMAISTQSSGQGGPLTLDQSLGTSQRNKQQFTCH